MPCSPSLEYIALPKPTTALNNELLREKYAPTVGAHEPALGISRILRNSAFYTPSATTRQPPPLNVRLTADAQIGRLPQRKWHCTLYPWSGESVCSKVRG